MEPSLVAVLPLVRAMAIDGAVFIGSVVLLSRAMRVPWKALLQPAQSPNGPSAPGLRRAALCTVGPVAVYLFSAALFVLAIKLTPSFSTRIVVADGFPAAAAGLKDGDQIVDIDGTATRTFDEVSRSVASKRGGARSMRVTVSRPNANQGTERMTVDIAPDESGLIGVRPSGDLASASWATALGAGLRAPWTSLIRTAQMCREILSGGQQAMPLTTVSALRARNEPSFVGPLLTSFGIECAVVWPVFVLLAVVLGLRSNWRIA